MTSELTDANSPSLTVAVGAPSTLRDWPEGDPLLLVEANPDRLEQLNLVLKEHQREYSLFHDVLSSEEGILIDWLTFNDRRFDGPLDLDCWHEKYPNLFLCHREQRVGRRLAELIDTWLTEHVQTSFSLLHLVVRQGDPLAALMGLGTWFDSLQSVRLDMPMLGEYWFLKIDPWLQERAFRPVPGVPHGWQRDPVETLRLAMANQQAVLADLQEKLAQAVFERDYHIRRANMAESTLDQLNHEVQEMLALILPGQRQQGPYPCMQENEVG